jgi:hypothetical protein
MAQRLYGSKVRTGNLGVSIHLTLTLTSTSTSTSTSTFTPLRRYAF